MTPNFTIFPAAYQDMDLIEKAILRLQNTVDFRYENLVRLFLLQLRYGIEYVDMHIMINANTTTEQAHELSHNIEREIKNRINPNCQVIIHIEPYHKKENVL